MNLVNYLEFLEPMQDNVAKIYSTASEIIAVIVVLWLVTFVAGLIQKTFAIGKAFGGIYRNYLHPFIKTILLQLISLLKGNKTNKKQISKQDVRANQIMF